MNDEPVSDAQREVAVRQIQQAVARDQIDFDELDARFEAIYNSATRGELEAVTADLPTPPPPAPVPRSHPAPPSSTSVFGDIKLGGDIEVGTRFTCTTVFGDVKVDLSSANLVEGSTIVAQAVFGDLTVILPDGVRVARKTMTVFGDQKEDLSPPFGDAPTINVVTRSVFGDSKVYSLSRVPEGKIRAFWRALRS